MSKTRLVFLGLLALGVLGTILPASATAAHFYIKNELNEEFKKITSTVEANVESNGALEFLYKRATEVKILCHVKGEEKLFTNGEDELTNLKVSSCSSGSCIVKSFVEEKPPADIYLTILGEHGLPVTYTDDIEAGLEVWFNLSSCPQSGFYGVISEPEYCETEVDNTVDLELIFPEKPKTGGCWRSIGERLGGRLRLVPKVGRALRVGP